MFSEKCCWPDDATAPSPIVTIVSTSAAFGPTPCEASKILESVNGSKSFVFVHL